MPRWSLFDHLKNLFVTKIPYKDLSDEDKKSWNTYMIHRYLSMDRELLPLVNDVQSQRIPDDMVMAFWMSMLPKRQKYSKYVKGVKTIFDPEEIDIISKHYECGRFDAEFIRTLYDEVPQGKEELNYLLEQYGATASIDKGTNVSNKKVKSSKKVKKS